jgi:hypothetical protein
MSPEPRQRLSEILARFGTSIADDPRRCEGVLRDLCGNHRREINLLVAALKERVPSDLLTASAAVPREVLVARLTRRMQDNQGTSEEFAYWAVESWALALGVIAAGVVGSPKGPKPGTAGFTSPPASGRGLSGGAPPPPPPPPKRFWPWLIALFVLVLGVSLLYRQMSRQMPQITAEAPAPFKGASSKEGPSTRPASQQPAVISHVPPERPSPTGAESKQSPIAESVPEPTRLPPSSAPKSTPIPADVPNVPDLDPKQKVFVVSTRITVPSEGGGTCALTRGDIISRTRSEPNRGDSIDVKVVSSKPGDCLENATVSVDLAALRRMHDEFQQQIDAGSPTLSKSQADGGLSTSQAPPSIPAPTIVAFEAVPTPVEQCAVAILRWTVKGASSVSIDSGVGAVGATGYRALRPLQTTRYTLTANSPGGSVNRDVTLSVSHAMRSTCGQ